MEFCYAASHHTNNILLSYIILYINIINVYTKRQSGFSIFRAMILHIYYNKFYYVAVVIYKNVYRDTHSTSKYFNNSINF